MEQKNLNYFLALVVVILVMFCGPANALRCYSNGRDDYLKTERGKIGLEECTTSGSECYEALAERNYVIVSVVFKSGCDECPYWKPIYTHVCKKCTTDFCNHELADQVRKTHRLCYYASDHEDVGKRTVYCDKDIQKCFVKSYVNPINRVRYFFANCGSEWEGCLKKKCHICDTNLCNLPPDLVDELKPQRDKLLQELEKGWVVEPGQNPVQQPQTVNSRFPASSQANLDWLKNQPPPTQPPPSNNQGNSSAWAKRTVTDVHGSEDDEDEKVASGSASRKVKNSNTASETLGPNSDLDNGSASMQRIGAGAIDWRLHAAVAASMLVVVVRELHVL